MRDERLFLLDMVENAKRVQRYVAGRSIEDLRTDEQFQDSVLRRLGIIGEAASRITPPTRQLITLPWRSIIDMRNILIHVYFGIDLSIIWKTATEDMAPLISAVEAYLSLNPLPPKP